MEIAHCEALAIWNGSRWSRHSPEVTLDNLLYCGREAKPCRMSSDLFNDITTQWESGIRNKGRQVRHMRKAEEVALNYSGKDETGKMRMWEILSRTFDTRSM